MESLPSNRSFGFFIVAVFLTGSGLFYYDLNLRLSFFMAGVGFIFLVITIFAPTLLFRLNKSWQHLGILLGRIVNPVVLAVIFYVLVTPLALVCRALGRDELRLKRQLGDTYWREREKQIFNEDFFKNQF